MGTRGERIKYVRDQLGLSQEAFAQKVGVEKASVWNWEHDIFSTLRSDSLLAIQRVSGFNATWIETGTGPEKTGMGEERAVYNVTEGPEVTPVPLISWVQAGSWQDVVDNYRPGEGEKPVYTTRKVGKRAYALRVVGDSMENPNGRPTYPEGSIIIVDPDRAATNGSAVICRGIDTKQATFKQLVVDGGERYLKPLNTRYPVMPFREDTLLCGVVVQTIMDED